MDDVFEWVLEAHSHFLETGEILQLHHVPRLTRYNKHALAYEIEFLKIAVSLWKRLPRTIGSIFPVYLKGNHIYLLIGYDPNHRDLSMPPAVVAVTPEQFLRPSKKVRGGKQDMKITQGAT